MELLARGVIFCDIGVMRHEDFYNKALPLWGLECWVD